LQYLSRLTRLAFLQITAALRTGRRGGGVACPAESAMDVCAGFGSRDSFFVRDHLFIRRALELHVVWLRRAAVLTSLDRARIAPVTVRTDPFKLNETFTFFSIHLALL
jgi:hypothetical protein